MTRHAIPPQDQLWLDLDRPTNLMMITSVLWTARPVAPDALRALVTERLLGRYPVFGRRVVDGALPGQAWWEDDPDFDLDRHVLVGELPEPGDRAALEAFVGRQRGTPLDREHPLWSVHLLSGYGAGSAVVQRYHHAIADGIRLMEVGLGLLDPVEGTDVAPAARVGASGPLSTGTHPARTAERALRAAGVGPLVDAATAADALLPEALRPAHLVDSAADRALTLLHTAGSAVKIAAWSNPHTALDGEPRVEKTAVWADPVPLPRLREIAACADGTVADVCTALVAGAVGRYLTERGEAAPEDLAWMVPVNLVPFNDALPPSLGNHFALVLAVLPHTPMPLRDRVAEVHRRMLRIRSSYEPMITSGITQAVALAPAPVGRWLGDALAAKAVGVVTNVPGPRAPMALAGARVEGMVGWAPCSARQALTVCVVSYAGAVTFGFGTDRAVISDPERLVAALDAELALTTTTALRS
jgi:diacylglycerol O-acyltransferase